MKKQQLKKLELKKHLVYQLLGGVTDPNDDPIYDKKSNTCRSPCQGGTGTCSVY